MREVESTTKLHDSLLLTKERTIQLFRNRNVEVILSPPERGKNSKTKTRKLRWHGNKIQKEKCINVNK